MLRSTSLLRMWIDVLYGLSGGQQLMKTTGERNVLRGLEPVGQYISAGSVGRLGMKHFRACTETVG